MSFAVNIQQLNIEPNIINTGKNVIGKVIKSTPKPYIFDDNVCMIDLEVIYRENKLKNANGMRTGMPPLKNTPMKIIKLK